MIRERLGKYVVRVWDPLAQKQQWLGTYPTREEAEEAEREATKWGVRKCVGCGRRFRGQGPNHKRCVTKCGVPEPRKIVDTGDHWVYRCFDKRGDLLYIGLSSAGLRRFKEHTVAKAWWPQVDSIKLEHYPTRALAERAEAEAIRRLRPPHNEKGKPKLEKVVRLDKWREARGA